MLSSFRARLIPLWLRRAYWDLDAGIQELRAPRVRIPTPWELVDALDERDPRFAAAKRHARASDVAAARHLIVEHFHAREAPRFFVTVDEARRIAGDVVQSHPDWARQSLQTANASIVGFKLRGSGAPAPDWNALPLWPGKDTLSWHRPHQLYWMTHLARAHLYGHDSFADLSAGFDSWMRSLEVGRRSAAYGDALIAVHRGVSLTWTLHFLTAANRSGEALPFDLLRVLLSDVRFVHGRLGKSYPNNHLLADGFFCWYIGLLLPEFAEAARWRSDGEALWLGELRRQVLPDGSSFEHSVHYHELVCEMITAYVLLLRRNALEVPEWVEERARGMLSFQAALGGPEAATMPIGDAVEDTLFPLDDCEDVGSGAHREILRTLYEPSLSPLAVPERGAQRAIWLLAGAKPPASSALSTPARTAYPVGGVFVLSDKSERDRLVFRTGPQRDAPLTAGHMHADLLSIGVTIDGNQVLVDPGTYSYRSRPEAWPREAPAWRKHFMSPEAHNGPCIEGEDPLDRGDGDFPAGTPKSWIRHELVLISGELSCVSASIEGFTPYAGHNRTVLQVREEYWLVVDRFPPALRKPAFLNFQFAHGARLLQLSEQRIQVSTAGTGLSLVTHNLMTATKFCGQLAPTAGWVSPAYGTVQSAPCVRLAPMTPTLPAVTVIMPGSAPPPKIDLTPGLGSDLRMDLRFDGWRDVVHLGLTSRDAGRCHEGAFELDGAVAWVRLTDDVPRRAAAAGEASCAIRIGGADVRRVQQFPGDAAGAVVSWSRTL